ncbi:NAD(P)/FAD-dependent oxidoreductase [Gordonia rubripertincta]|uniref:NAD(P)/FAD-dependent oxidoreductase n=1 Tax=Gordonia rubripertincta TaxID=36822 RepID=A0AAW4G732_GORRU|nr:NAD(P)/FAD-dependent oxidoreductase [Gordonia rubripertincta]MBM7278953.1 NAD(P)/FAD-dependent oxidoreductase [Gordonia rubripertincta]
MERTDCLVVGGGIVGLAVARAVAATGREVVVLEAADSVGTQTTSRSSEVIHAGIYYPEGSLKARLCVRGRELLTRYCDEHGVSWRRPGKLIVAVDDAQTGRLDVLLRHGHTNGVGDLRRIDGVELHELEPDVHGVAALLSPSTGIVDVDGVVGALRRDLESAGGAVALRSRVIGGRVDNGGVTVDTAEGGSASARVLVNCAGLGAWDVARSLDGFDGPVPPRHLAKGNYFGLSGARAPFQHLVYPVPVDGGLGVHFTMDLAGAARFGPDVEWLDGDSDAGDLDYSVDETRLPDFEGSIRRYWPGLLSGALAPAYAGIRPKTSGPGEAAADFVIDGPATHGHAGLVNLFGIESPGITSCLAIGEYVVGLMGGEAR